MDRRQVAPHLLAADLPVAELEHVQETEAHLAAAAGAEEGAPVLDPPVPERLVDQEVVAVVAAQRLDVLARDGGEEELVVGAAP